MILRRNELAAAAPPTPPASPRPSATPSRRRWSSTSSRPHLHARGRPRPRNLDRARRRSSAAATREIPKPLAARRRSSGCSMSSATTPTPCARPAPPRRPRRRLLAAAEAPRSRRRPGRARLRPQRPARPPTSSTTAPGSGWSTGNMPASTRRSSISAASPPTPACRRPSATALLAAYFGRPLDRRAAPPRRRDDRRLAPARDDVEHGLGAPLQPSTSTTPPTPPRTSPASTRACAAFQDGRHDACPPRPAVVIVGGGIVGCSTAYHLGAHGHGPTCCCWSAHQLTSGSTWHAAGLVGQLRTSANITQLLGYSVDALRAAGGRDRPRHRLEDERRPAARLQRPSAGPRSSARPPPRTSFGLEMHLLSPAEAQDALAADDGRRRGRRRLPADRRPGQPVRHHPGARQGRAHRTASTIREDVAVTGFDVEDGRVTRRRDRPAAASPARRSCSAPASGRAQLGAPGRRQRAAGQPVQHQYVDHRADRRRHARPADPARSRPPHLLQGGGRRPRHGRLRAEPDALGRATACPDDFEFQLLDDDWDHFEPHHGAGAGRVPALETRRHQAADQRPGELHPRRQLHPRRGAGGAKLLRRRRLQRLRHRLGRRRRHGAGRMGREGRAALRPLAGRHPPLRPQPPATTAWVRTRTLEAYGKHYTMAWPHEEYASGRPLRRSPLYERLQGQGAVLRREARLGAAELVRRPPATSRATSTPCGRQNWFDAVGREHRAVPRARSALFDQTSFAKFMLIGRDAEAALVLDLRQRRRQAAGQRSPTPRCSTRAAASSAT